VTADLQGVVEFVEAPVDVPEAARCIQAYFAELQSRFPAGFDPRGSVSADPDELVRPRGVFLLLRREGEVIGCGGVKTIEAGVGEIKRMWIAPGARGIGLGKRLLDALEIFSAGLGHRAVRLDTSAHLPEAIALYRGAGYREIADYNGNPYAAHWFEKQLSPSGSSTSGRPAP
jgi:GNAT superfamily N-acetyltransferase